MAQGGIGFGNDDDYVADDAVADKCFLSVEYVVIAYAFRCCANGCQVAACAWLGHGDGGDEFACTHAWKPALFLFFVCIGYEVW